MGIQSFGQTMKEIREEIGIGVRRMAREIGVSKSTIQHWEHGRALPTQKNLIKTIEYVQENECDFEALFDNYATDEVLFRELRKVPITGKDACAARLRASFAQAKSRTCQEEKRGDLQSKYDAALDRESDGQKSKRGGHIAKRWEPPLIIDFETLQRLKNRRRSRTK